MTEIKEVGTVTPKVFEVRFQALLTPEDFEEDLSRAKRAVRNKYGDVGKLRKHYSSQHPGKTPTNVIWLTRE